MTVATKAPLRVDADEVRRTLKLLVEPGSTVEMRVILTDGRIMSGYYRDGNALLKDVTPLGGPADVAGFYITLNPVNPALLARAENHLRKKLGKKDSTTSDNDVERRARLLIDLDAKRPSGIASTDREHVAAFYKATTVREALRALGWPEPLLADSGNGCHLVYKIDLPADDGGLVERVLAGLAAKYDDDQIKVDRVVHNASRISKLYGTPVRKGDNTKDRPHRMARILDDPDHLEVVSRELLEKVAAPAPVTTKTHHKNGPASETPEALGAWLTNHGIEFKEPKVDDQGRTIFNLEACPFDASHNGTSVCVGLMPSGAKFFRCHHDGCTGKEWQDFKAVVAPDDKKEQLEAARAELEKILAATETDPGAASEPDALEVLAAIRKRDHAAWARARATLKRNKVPLRDLERALKQVEEEEAERSETYSVESGGIWRAAGDSVQQLTNFTAKILSDLVEDDGAETRRILEIEATLGARTAKFTVPAESFEPMRWPIDRLGSQAVVYPGRSTADHARAAIQLLSGPREENRVFVHCGWREIQDEWFYLHGAGAIGSDGQREDVSVRLNGPLARYLLPDSPEGADLVAAIRASLRMLEVAPDRVSLPCFAAVWRAPLGYCDTTLWLAGKTGGGKSAVAALVQQHWGAGMDGRNLPCDWSWTENALEKAAFLAKDAVLTIDEFVPPDRTHDMARIQQKIERVLRAAGNGSGRGRMKADTTLRPVTPPRGLIVSTGEDVPQNYSLRARLTVVDVRAGDVDFEKLTTAQADAASGLYAQALAAYLHWLAPKYEEIRKTLADQVAGLRGALTGEHRRTPEALANFLIGIDSFTRFAVDSLAMTEEERQDLLSRCRAALAELGHAQQEHQAHAEPAARFLALLGGAVMAGRAYVSKPSESEGIEPDVPYPTPGRWGWRQQEVGRETISVVWRSSGDHVGWIEDDALYLDPEAAYAAAKRFADGGGFGVTLPTLTRRLKERGLLLSSDGDRATVKKIFDGQRRRVLHLSIDALWPSDDGPPAGEPGQPGHNRGTADSCSGKTSNELPRLPRFPEDVRDSYREREERGPTTPALSSEPVETSPTRGKPGQPGQSTLSEHTAAGSSAQGTGAAPGQSYEEPGQSENDTWERGRE